MGHKDITPFSEKSYHQGLCSEEQTHNITKGHNRYRKKYFFSGLGIIWLCVGLVSCSSIKKNSNSGFEKTSDFLDQGVVIENTETEKKEEVVEVKFAKEKTEEPKQKKIEEKKVEPKAPKKAEVEVEKKIKKQKEDKIKQKSFPFFPGEEVVLSASFFGVEAGKIYIGVDTPKLINGKKRYHFYAEGRTTSVFSFFYKVKNKIESLWDPIKERPAVLSFDAKETKQKYKARAYYDWGKMKVDYFEEGWSKKKGDYKEEKSWQIKVDQGQDILSTAFYMRAFPLEVGKSYKIIVLDQEKVIEATVKVTRKEVLDTRVGKIPTLVLKPTFKTDGKFEQVGEISIWVTDDKYKQIVRVESKIKIGTIVASLHSLKRPKNSD